MCFRSRCGSWPFWRSQPSHVRLQRDVDTRTYAHTHLRTRAPQNSHQRAVYVCAQTSNCRNATRTRWRCAADRQARSPLLRNLAEGRKSPSLGFSIGPKAPSSGSTAAARKRRRRLSATSSRSDLACEAAQSLSEDSAAGADAAVASRARFLPLPTARKRVAEALGLGRAGDVVVKKFHRKTGGVVDVGRSVWLGSAK